MQRRSGVWCDAMPARSPEKFLTSDNLWVAGEARIGFLVGFGRAPARFYRVTAALPCESE